MDGFGPGFHQDWGGSKEDETGSERGNGRERDDVNFHQVAFDGGHCGVHSCTSWVGSIGSIVYGIDVS